MEPYRWDIASVGWGLAGEGGTPLPCLGVSCGGVLTSGSTPTSRRFQRPPPPSIGGGSAWRWTRMQCQGVETDFGEGDRVDGREVVFLPGSVSMGYRPWGGADGGGWNIPSLSRRVTEDVFPCEQSSYTPAAWAPPGRRSPATVSDVDLDLVSALSRWMTSLFCPSDVYFHPYDADEIRGILRDRIRFGLYPGVFRQRHWIRLWGELGRGGSVGSYC